MALRRCAFEGKRIRGDKSSAGEEIKLAMRGLRLPNFTSQFESGLRDMA